MVASPFSAGPSRFIVEYSACTACRRDFPHLGKRVIDGCNRQLRASRHRDNLWRRRSSCEHHEQDVQPLLRAIYSDSIDGLADFSECVDGLGKGDILFRRHSPTWPAAGFDAVCIDVGEHLYGGRCDSWADAEFCSLWTRHWYHRRDIVRSVVAATLAVLEIKSTDKSDCELGVCQCNQSTVGVFRALPRWYFV